MREKIYSRYLYQMLMEFGRVSIENVGTWSLSIRSSRFSPNKQTLLPPQTTVSFTSDFIEGYSFQELLIESGCDMEMAQKLEGWLIEDCLKCQATTQVFPLYGLGQVANNVFVCDDNQIFDKFAGWGEMASPYIPQIEKNITHSEDYLFRLNNPYKEEKDNSSLFYLWPILVGLFVMGFVLFWFLNPDTKKINQKTVLVEKTDKPLSNDTSTDIDTSKFEMVDSTVIKEQIIASENDSVKSLNDNEEHSESQVSKECILIVGSFKYKSNSNRMIETLQNKGFKHYVEMHDGMKRVGIIYNCESHNPDDYKKEMRQGTYPGAWNLHDTL